jgi:MFS family permease
MPKIDWRPWIVLAVFSLLLFLITAATYSSLGVVLPAMIKSEGWSFSSAFLGFTLLGAFCGFSSWLPPILIRRIGIRGTILVGSAMMAAGLACLAVTRGLWVYWIGTALCGVAYQAMALIPGTQAISMLFKRRALPFGVYFTVGSLGGFAGPWMAMGVMGGADGAWRTYWWIQAAAALVIGLICALVIGRDTWLQAYAQRTDAAVLEEARTAPANAQVYRTARDWTVGEALRTPQFYILLAAYFSHLLGGVTVASLSVTHLTEIGVAATVAAGMLSVESLMQTGARLSGGLIGDRVDPRWMLAASQAVLALGLWVLGFANTYPLMMIYALGTGVGFGLTVLAVTVLLLNYYGRKHNLELFSLTCLVGGFSAMGPVLGGFMRDHLGSFVPTFHLYAAVIGAIFVAVLFMRPPVAARPGAETAAAPLLQDPA